MLALAVQRKDRVKTNCQQQINFGWPGDTLQKIYSKFDRRAGGSDR